MSEGSRLKSTGSNNELKIAKELVTADTYAEGSLSGAGMLHLRELQVLR